MLAVVLSFDQFPLRLLGCYGNSINEMSCLNEIAAESIVFDQHFGEDFSPAPEGHAWWTGCYHFPRQGSAVVSRMPTLPLLLQAGDVTFEWIEEDLHRIPVPMPRQVKSIGCDSFEDIIVEASKFLDYSSKTIESHQMLWVKVGPSAWTRPLGPWGASENAEVLARLDQIVEPLWQIVRSLASSRKVLFIFTAARGLSLGERAESPNTKATWREEFVHLPLIVHHSETAGGERRSELTQTMDLPATLLDFFALQPPTQWEGRSILPSVLGQTEAARDFVTSGCQGVWESIRTREFHLIRRIDPAPPEATRRLLFTKPDDVWDWQDVSPQEPEMTEALTRQLDAFLLTAKSDLPVILPASGWAIHRKGEGAPP